MLISIMVPVINMLLRSFEKGKIMFSKTYMFVYQPLQIAIVYYLMCLKPPFTIFPEESALAELMLVYSCLVYFFVIC